MQPFDALTMRAIIQEARPLLLNRRIDKIQQLSRDEVVLALRSKAGTAFLLVSAQASFGRLCLVLTAPPPKTQSTPAFCQILRKHLSSGTLVALDQIPGERIADLVFACTDELGNRSTKILTAEIMGRHSNLILWDKDTETILGASHNVTQEMSRQREVAPGLRYCRPPKQEKPGIFFVTADEFANAFSVLKSAQLEAEEIKTYEQWLMSTFAGLGRHLSEEIIEAARLLGGFNGHPPSESTRSALWSKVSAIQSSVAYDPSMREDLTRFSVVSWWKQAAPEQADQWKEFPSANDMVDAYFRGIQLRTEIQQLKDRIRSELRSEEEKLKFRLNTAEKLLGTSRDHHHYKNYGDMILANLKNLHPGQSVLQCPDLYTESGAKVEIALNPNLNGSQNAQSYYRLFAKSRTRCHTARASHQDAAARLEEVNSHFRLLDKADSLLELQSLKERVLDRGKKAEAPQQNQQRPRDNKPSQPRLMSIKSSDGLTIIVGRNKTENDVLISKLTQPHDIWLHAQGLEGAHVVIKTQNKKEPPATTLREAAQVAARFARTGLGGKIKIVYTLGKYVRKLGKDKPGLVRYENERTLEVDTTAPMPPSLRRLFT